MSDTQQSEPQQTELLAVPGWSTPFPPEQPRRDADDSAQAAGIPTAASVAAASAIGEEAEADFTTEDRRPLDRRRRRARAIDSMILLPAAALALYLTKGDVTLGAGLLVLALDLSYFFVMEAVKGQTIGKKFANLRVMHVDGSAASAGRIALRTITRPLDYTFVGFLTVLATGKRRQRIGDLLARTIVRDDNREFKRAPESPLLVVFPLVVIGLAVAAMIAFKPVDSLLAKRTDHPYMAKIDRICEKQQRQATALDNSGQLDYIGSQILFRQQARKIEKLPTPPADVRDDVRQVLRFHSQVNQIFTRTMREMRRSPDPSAVVAQQEPIVIGLRANAADRFDAMGLPYCADGMRVE